MITLIIGLACWFTGWAVTARQLFLRWRPSRVPLCDMARHYSNNCQDCRAAICKRSHHLNKCYRRPKADLTHVAIDRDSYAAGWAAFAALAWPFVLGGLLIMHNPPELPQEKAKRLADTERELGIHQGDAQ